MSGTGCPYCKGAKLHELQTKPESQFQEELAKIQPNIITTTPYLNARKPIGYKCIIHDYIGSSTPDNLLRGYGCPYCAGKSMTANDFWKRVNLHGNDITYHSEFKTVNDYISCECNLCHTNWTVEGRHLLEGSGCPVCNSSKGENIISKYLSDHKADFVPHYKYNDLLGVGGRHLSYDFYLPKYNLLIEFQGEQHDKPLDYFGGEKRFEIQQEHDKRKREYALSHSVDLLEIWYYDIGKIGNILNERLSLS